MITISRRRLGLLDRVAASVLAAGLGYWTLQALPDRHAMLLACGLLILGASMRAWLSSGWVRTGQ